MNKMNHDAKRSVLSRDHFVNQDQRGFSLSELLVVLVIIGIMSALAIFYGTSHKKAYQPDDQALLLTDMLQEARQRALTQRRAMRVEINLTNNTAKLYDENTNVTVATDDFMVKSLNLFNSSAVRVDVRPSDVTYNPGELAPVPNAQYSSSVYPTSISQNVCTIRFLANGTAVNAGTNAVGSGAVPTGVTIHIWSPSKADNTKADILNAITILGATGLIRMWEFRKDSTASNKWYDSRRSGSY